MLTSGDAVGEADPLQHLAEVRRRRGVHERGVALHPHRLDHAERGQRVDEARRALRRVGAVGQRQAQHRRHAAVLGVRRAADDADRPAEQRLRFVRRPGGDHDAGALVADRHRLAAAAGQAAHASAAGSSR